MLRDVAVTAERSAPRLSQAPSRPDVLLRVYNESHVPLTPALANELWALETCAVPAQSRLWGQAYLRAGEAMGLPGRIGTVQSWQDSLRAFHGAVAEPVLRWAALSVGRMDLRGDYPLGDNFKTLAASDAEVEKRVKLAMSDTQVLGRGFWIEAGLRLWLASAAGRESEIPELQPGIARFLFELDPAMGDQADRLRRLRDRRPSRNLRSGIRPREGGVAGVRVSTVLDDLTDALPTELIFPEEILADRMLHEGLVVRHRPPPRLPKRDLLVVVIGRGGANEGNACELFAKAAWIDAAIRLRILLAQMGLHRSELVWAEGVSGHVRSNILSVEGFKSPNAVDPFALSGDLRADHLFACGLLPRIASATSLTGDHSRSSTSADRYTALDEVLACVQRDLRSRLPMVQAARRPAARADLRPGDLADYGRILVVSVLPGEGPQAQEIEESWAIHRGALARKLGGTLPSHARFAALICPPALTRDSAFRLFADGHRHGALPEIDLGRQDEPLEAVNSSLGFLSLALMEAAIEVLHA